MSKLKILIAIILLLFPVAASALTVNLDPPSLRPTITESGNGKATVYLRNDGKQEVEIKAYAQDWEYKKDGSKNFLAAGESRFSCARWISLDQNSFKVAPGEELPVILTIAVPKGASGGYYAVVFFEAREAGRSANIAVAGRIGTIVYLEVEGTANKKATVSGLYALAKDEEGADLSFEFQNQGNVHLTAIGNIVLVGRKGKVYGRVKTPPLKTLPGETRKVKLAWKGRLPKLPVDAVLTLDYGTIKPLIEVATVKRMK